MKKGMFVGTMLLALYAISAVAAELPAGSYTQTCTNVALQGETLSASCKRFDGSTTNTQLPFATSCVGNVSNVDGNLVCTGPTGSFARTCKDAVVKNGQLTANCQRKDGTTWKQSTTSFSGFQHQVTNCDGTLVDKPNC